MVVIQIVSRAAEELVGRGPEAGMYIQDYDPSQEDSHGYGKLTLTKELSKAQQFPSSTSAILFWRQESLTLPNRPDGRPNRPLTAFTVSIQDVKNAIIL